MYADIHGGGMIKQMNRMETLGGNLPVKNDPHTVDTQATEIATITFHFTSTRLASLYARTSSVATLVSSISLITSIGH